MRQRRDAKGHRVNKSISEASADGSTAGAPGCLAAGPKPQPNADASPRSLRSEVLEHVRSSERIITALRGELAESRKKNIALLREQQEMVRALARMHWVGEQVKRSAAVRKPPPSKARVQRTAQSEAEVAELQRRCDRLEQALATRNAELRASRDEIGCLEEVIQELQNIVELLGLQLRGYEEER
jgi:chromosome segregation ATPase